MAHNPENTILSINEKPLGTPIDNTYMMILKIIRQQLGAALHAKRTEPIPHPWMA